MNRHTTCSWLTAEFIAGSIAVLLIAGLLCPLPNTYRAIWLSCLMDVLHAPVFALITFVLRLLFRKSLILTILLAVGVALLTEAVQAVIGRSMSLEDLAYNGLGVAAAVIVLWPSDRAKQVARRRKVIVAILLLMAPLGHTAPVLIDASLAAGQFPVLSDFSSRWETERWYTSDVGLRRVFVDGSWQGEVDHPTTAVAGGAILFPVIRNWSAYERLWCEFSFTGSPMSVLISVRDAEGRIEIHREYSSGTHRVSLNLRAPVSPVHSDSLDLNRIQSFHFVVDAPTNRSALIHYVCLE